MSDETNLDLEGIKARRAAITDAQTQVELMAAYVAKDQHDDDDINALIVEVEALRAEVGRLKAQLEDNPHVKECRDCNGYGSIDGESCEFCDGVGWR